MDKVYVDVLAVFSREGELIPKAFVWEDGHRYEIDKISKPERCASRKAGGTGYRYTCMVEGKICHLTYEENYKWFMFQQIIRGAKDFLQEMIFKFKLPPKPVPKIDLQEWNDMRKLMEKLQKQSQAMKFTQQEISSLKKQLSETTGFFKGKVRKSLEGRIEQAEKQEKRIHTDMDQTVKQAGYPDVQSFAKTYQKSEKLVREYNEELRAWANQTEPEKEKPSEPPKKASIREKLHRYQQESRQQAKQTSMDRER